MSGRLVGEVLRHAPTDLTPSERLVYLALAETARDTDRIARLKCSATDLATVTCTSPKTVHNALYELRRRGLIKGLRDDVSKGGKHQEYYLTELSEHHRNATIRTTHRFPTQGTDPT